MKPEPRRAKPSRRVEPVTIKSIRATHRERGAEIRQRLAEFDAIWRSGSDARIWEELSTLR